MAIPMFENIAAIETPAATVDFESADHLIVGIFCGSTKIVTAHTTP
jgi:hypothetical protein